MSLSLYNIVKWTKMLTGNSILHVNQGMGKCFISGQIQGYFNDMTEKVIKDPDTLKKQCVPLIKEEKIGVVYFPVAVIQYGLGAYDLYLMTKKDIYIEQFWRCVNSVLEHQKGNGAWDNFGFVYPNAPYGAMCQGEAASLLVRAYANSGERKYFDAAKKAIDYMLLPLDEGGTTGYDGEQVVFYEFTNSSAVLNGWIFSLYGLYDLSLVDGDQKYRDILSKSVRTLAKYIPKFDNGYWSMYDLGGRITSPFYHSLHIAQLEALEKTFGGDVFGDYKQRFEEYKMKRIFRYRAFVVKAYQKIIE